MTIAGLLILAACGGSDAGVADDVGDDTGPAVVDGTSEAASTDRGDDESAGGDPGGSVGPVTVSADPSTAWVEAGDERIEFNAAIDMNSYECSIGTDQIVANYQMINGPSLLVMGGLIDGVWRLNLTVDSVAEENVQYSATMPGDSGSLGLSADELSYEGPINRVVDRDILNPQEVNGRLAINCALPDDQPTAVIDGTEYTLSMVGASSVQCEIGPDLVDIDINRLTVDDTNLQLDAAGGSDGWSGLIAVSTPTGTYVSSDLTGLVVDGETVRYEGTLDVDGAQVQGSLVVTCP